MSHPPVPQLSVILPCYNPPENWQDTVREYSRALARELGFSPEIIIVNDGSATGIDTPGKEQLEADIPGLRICGYTENRGKGYALRYGVKEASGSKIIYTDIDFPYTTSSIIDIWKLLEQDGSDVAIGVKDSSYYEQVPRIRVFISRILRGCIGFFFSMPVTDTQCGLKGFSLAGKEVFLQTRTDRYLCDLEFVFRAYRQKSPALKIIPQPVKLREGIQFRKMDLRILARELFNFTSILFRRN